MFSMGLLAAPQRTDCGVIRGFLFIAFFAFWLLLVSELNSSKLRSKKPLASYLLTSVITVIAFIIFVALHAGGISWRPVLAFGLISGVSPLLFFMVISFYRFDLRAIEAGATWSGLEMPAVARFLLLPISLVLLGYLLAALFTIVAPVSDPMKFAVRSAVIAIYGLAIPSILWVFIRLIASPYWTEDFRTAIAVCVLPGIFNASVLLLLGLWSFNLVGTGRALSLFGAHLTFSPLIIISTIAATILTFILPFLRGSAASRGILTKFQKARVDALDAILLELSAPSHASPHKVLQTIRSQIETDMDRFWDTFPVLGIAGAIESEELSIPIKKELIVLARANDLRFIQWSWFLELTIKLEESELDLSAIDVLSRPAAVTRWIKHFDSLRTIQAKHHSEISGRRAPLVVVGSVIVTVISTKALELLWKYCEPWLK
jgi:hypothetical protein